MTEMHDAKCIVRGCDGYAEGEWFVPDKKTLPMCETHRQSHGDLLRYYEWTPYVPAPLTAQRIGRMAEGFFG